MPAARCSPGSSTRCTLQGTSRSPSGRRREGPPTATPTSPPRPAGPAVRAGAADRGVIVCGSGAGVAVAATKMRGIRAAVAHDTYTAHQMVEHDDVNVLCLGGAGLRAG